MIFLPRALPHHLRLSLSLSLSLTLHSPLFLALPHSVSHHPLSLSLFHSLRLSLPPFLFPTIRAVRSFFISLSRAPILSRITGRVFCLANIRTHWQCILQMRSY